MDSTTFDPPYWQPFHPESAPGTPEDDPEVVRIRLDLISQANKRCDEGFPIRYRGAYTDHKRVIEWVDGYCTNPADTPSLFLLGPTGTGKTWQAYAALRRAVTHPRLHMGRVWRCDSWKATNHPDLLASMRPSMAKDTEEVFKTVRDTPLLLLDDLGVAKGSEWAEETIYRLINGRYESMLPTIFTSNLAVDQLVASLGDRIASRLAETCLRVVLDGPDRRRAKASA